MAGGLVHQPADPDPSYQPGAGSISALTLATRPAPGGAPRLVAQSGGEFTGSGRSVGHMGWWLRWEEIFRAQAESKLFVREPLVAPVKALAAMWHEGVAPFSPDTWIAVRWLVTARGVLAPSL